MHEYSLMGNLLSHIITIAIENKARRVVSLTVKLGALSHLSSEHFCEHFYAAAKGGLAEGAKLQVHLDMDKESPSAQDVLLESLEFET